MDSQLKELLEQIKQEGVQKARTESEQIRKDAEAKARSLVADAEREAKAIREKAEQDALKTVQAGKDALTQAGRDLILSMQQELRRIFDIVIRRETETSMTGDSLVDVIAALVSAWVEQNDADIVVLLPEAQLKKLETQLRAKLSKELSSGVELRPAANLDRGFRVATGDGGVYYDFSSEGIAEVLGAYVNPRLAKTIQESVAGE